MIILTELKTCAGYALATDLTAISMNREDCDGGCHINLGEEKDILWQVKSGKIFYVKDGKTYYLTANGKTAVKLTNSSSEASTWTYASGRLTTPNGKKELCLTVSGGRYILTSGKAACEIYMQ